MKQSYIAHDQALFTLKNYAQMALLCFVTGVIIYGLAMFYITRHYFSDCLVPAMIERSGSVEISKINAPKLPLSAVFKYIMTTNIGNLFLKTEPVEYVEQDLKRFFNKDKVGRTIYCRGIELITHGKAREFRDTILPLSLLFFPFYGVGYFYVFARLTKKKRQTEFVRGTDILPINKLQERLCRGATGKEESHIKFGELVIPDEYSRLHTLILGATGSGKSVFINQVIRSYHQRRGQTTRAHKMILYDVKGELLAKHHDAGDLVFFPFDQRSLRWSFFNEIQDYPDLDIMATSLYTPPKQSKDEYWYNAARDVFRMGLYYLQSVNKKKNADIQEFFAGSLQEIKQTLSLHLPLSERGALKHIDKADSNQAASVISILQERLQFFKYIQDDDGDFSFRRYIENDDDERNLFLLSIRQYESIFKPLMTYIIDIMIRQVISLPDSKDRRIVFVIDEFGSLSLLPSIFDYLTMARSKGGVLYLINQDLGKVGDLYGEHNQSTFFNNFNIDVVFRLNDPKTAEYLANAFGEREVLKKIESRQMSPSDMGDRMTLSSQDKTEKVVMPTQFQCLPDFTAYVRFPNIGLTKMEIPRVFFDERNIAFMKRNFPAFATRQDNLPTETPPVDRSGDAGQDADVPPGRPFAGQYSRPARPEQATPGLAGRERRAPSAAAGGLLEVDESDAEAAQNVPEQPSTVTGQGEDDQPAVGNGSARLSRII